MALTQTIHANTNSLITTVSLVLLNFEKTVLFIVNAIMTVSA